MSHTPPWWRRLLARFHFSLMLARLLGSDSGFRESEKSILEFLLTQEPLSTSLGHLRNVLIPKAHPRPVDTLLFADFSSYRF